MSNVISIQKIKYKKSKREELESRRWGICSTDEKTLDKMFELFSAHGRLGPIHVFPFQHSIYMYRTRPRYNLPYDVIEYLVENKEADGYDFYAFSQIHRQTWALYREGMNKHTDIMSKVFDGTSTARNRRLGLNEVKEVMIPTYKRRR